MLTQEALKRTFQVWEFRVSHGSLLIRSPRSAEYDTNIDLICSGVEYMALPRFLKGVEIGEPTPGELKDLEQLLGKQLRSSEVRMITSVGRRFPVVGVSFKLDQNTKDIFDSPFENS